MAIKYRSNSQMTSKPYLWSVYNLCNFQCRRSGIIFNRPFSLFTNTGCKSTGTFLVFVDQNLQLFNQAKKKITTNTPSYLTISTNSTYNYPSLYSIRSLPEIRVQRIRKMHMHIQSFQTLQIRNSNTNINKNNLKIIVPNMYVHPKFQSSEKQNHLLKSHPPKHIWKFCTTRSNLNAVLGYFVKKRGVVQFSIQFHHKYRFSLQFI